MDILVHLHPIAVHFAVSFIVLACIGEIVAFKIRSDKLLEWSKLNLIVGLVGVVAATLTGLISKENIDIVISAKEVVELHLLFAYLLSGLVALLYVWRTFMEGEYYFRYKTFYILMAFVTLLVLIYCSYLGGKLVYNFGIGVRSLP